MLPEHDVVILDEAHSFPDNATNAFAGEISADALTRLSGHARRGPAPTRAAVNPLSEAGRALSAAIEARDGTVDVGADEELDQALLRRRRTARGARAPSSRRAGNDYAKRTAQRRDRPARGAAPARRARRRRRRVGRAGRPHRRLRIAPVAAGETIALRAARPAPGDRGVGDARRRAAVPRARVARWASQHRRRRRGTWGERDDDGRWTSDAGPRATSRCRRRRRSTGRTQGILYVAKDLPDPARARDGWMDALGRSVVRARERGRAAARSCCARRTRTSTRFADVLRERTDHDILAQGERDSGRLTQEFVEDETSVLVGTRSFWAGIDAAGRRRACWS